MSDQAVERTRGHPHARAEGEGRTRCQRREAPRVDNLPQLVDRLAGVRYLDEPHEEVRLEHRQAARRVEPGENIAREQRKLHADLPSLHAPLLRQQRQVAPGAAERQARHHLPLGARLDVKDIPGRFARHGLVLRRVKGLAAASGRIAGAHLRSLRRIGRMTIETTAPQTSELRTMIAHQSTPPADAPSAPARR